MATNVIKRINQIDVIATTIGDNDRFALDHDKGVADFETQQAKWETIRNQIGLDFVHLESTGILTGGEPTRISVTQFSVAAGTGQIVDHVSETITPVNWNAFSGITPDYLLAADEQYTYVYIDSNGDLQQQNIPFDAEDFRTKIVIGVITHTTTLPAAPPGDKIIIKVSSLARKLLTQTVEYGFDANADITVKITKPFRLKGSTNNNLNLGLELVDSTVGGEVQIIGAGGDVTPNYLPVTAVSEFTSCYLGYIKSTGEPTIWFQESGEVNPSVYNPSGSNLVILNEDWWVIHRLYYYADQAYPVVLTGRQQYETIHAALLNIDIEKTDDLELFSKYLKPTVFIGYLLVKEGTTNLNNAADALFISALEARGARYIDNVNCGIVGGGVISDEGGTNISWTGGQIYSICLGKTENFDADSATLTPEGIHYVYWQDGSGIITSTTPPSLPDVLLARVGVQNGDIVELFQENFLTTDFTAIKEALDRNFGLSVTEGMLVEPNPDVTYALDLKMTQGSYDINMRVEHPVDAVETKDNPLIRYFHTLGDWDDDTDPEIDTSNYDNGTNRVAIPANKWCVGVVNYQHDEQNDTSLLAWFYPTVLHDNQTAAEAYALQIQDGEIPIPNQPPGFVQSPTLMGYVFRQGDTTLADPATNPDRWVDLRPRVGNFIGGGGGAIVAVDGINAYFFGKHGNDSNNGKSREEAFLTIGAAITAVNAQSPSSTNMFAIFCDDGGIYIENPDLPAWTKLFAPNATAQGSLAVYGNSVIKLKQLNGTITNAVSSGTAIIDIDILKTNTSSIGLNISSTGCFVAAEFDHIIVDENAIGIEADNATYNNVHFNSLELIGANSKGILCQGGELNAYCNTIKEGAVVTGTTGVEATGGICNIYLAGTNTADTPFNENGGVINYISPAEGMNITSSLTVGGVLTSGSVIASTTVIGGSIQGATGSFTNIIVDKIDRSGGTVILRDSGEQVSISGLNYPIADGASGQAITTNGAGTLSFQTVSGGMVQRIDSAVPTASSGATAIPHDATIPQISEGTQLTTATITPTSTSNFFLLQAQIFFAPNPGGVYTTGAIFVGIGGVPQANAIVAVSNYETNNNGTSIITLNRLIPISSTSQHIFELRYGNNAATTVYINSTSTISPLFGGVANSFLRVEEWTL